MKALYFVDLDYTTIDLVTNLYFYLSENDQYFDITETNKLELYTVDGGDESWQTQHNLVNGFFIIMDNSKFEKHNDALENHEAKIDLEVAIKNIKQDSVEFVIPKDCVNKYQLLDDEVNAVFEEYANDGFTIEEFNKSLKNARDKRDAFFIKIITLACHESKESLDEVEELKEKLDEIAVKADFRGKNNE